MLLKLLKYDFWATRRFMFSMYIGILAIAGILAVTGVDILESNSKSILLVVYILAILVAVIASIVVSISVFNKTVLGPGGYLTLTLPVSVNSIIFSKLLISAIWIISTTVVIIFSTMIASKFQGSEAFIEGSKIAFQTIKGLRAAVISSIIANLLSTLSFIAMVYTGMTIASSFKAIGNKALASIIWVVLLMILSSMVGKFVYEPLVNALELQPHVNLLKADNIVGMGIGAQSAIEDTTKLNLFSSAYHIIYISLYFMATSYLLRNKLNLD